MKQPTPFFSSFTEDTFSIQSLRKEDFSGCQHKIRCLCLQSRELLVISWVQHTATTLTTGNGTADHTQFRNSTYVN